jgi:hypothetical protein
MTPTYKNSPRIGRRTAVAVAALLQSNSVAEAAQVIGVSTRTLQRWKADPSFADALLDAQNEIFFAACNEVRGLALDASRTLGKILRDDKQPAPSRVRASLAVLSLLMRTHTHEIVEARLMKLEAAKRRNDARRQNPNH